MSMADYTPDEHDKYFGDGEPSDDYHEHYYALVIDTETDKPTLKKISKEESHKYGYVEIVIEVGTDG